MMFLHQSVRPPLAVISITAAILTFSAPAKAEFPDHPVRIIVGFPPPSTTDLYPRLLAQELSAKWNQPVVVMNRTGASGAIAEEEVARSRADGYTLLVVPNNHTNIPTDHKLPYDPVKDFAPITLIGLQPTVLVVHKSVPVGTFKEFVAYVKQRPNELNFGSGGFGSTPFLEMEMLMQKTGLKLTHVAYDGGAKARVGVMSGEVQALFGPTGENLVMVNSGEVKPLAVSLNIRSPLFPDIPTIAEELNMPDFNMGGWVGMLAPAGTPPEIIAKIRDDVAEALKASDVKAEFARQDTEIVGSTPVEFAKFLADDFDHWNSLHDVMEKN